MTPANTDHNKLTRHAPLPPALTAGLLLLLAATAYLPGVGGPYFFDDYTNLLGNSYVRIASLDLESLHRAAFSLSAGPLQRPIAMVSFALNHYFAGGFENPAAFKSINVLLHVTNGILIYWLTRLILGNAQSLPIASTAQRNVSTHGAATVLALVWLLHPIQMTSVLYLVQRMTELSALFSLAALICYLVGRKDIVMGRHLRGVTLVLLAFATFWPAALYSKENALLLPLFALLLDYILFAAHTPWAHWTALPRHRRWITLAIVGLAASGLLAAAISYALPGYEMRSFSMGERVMTEGRVLFLYLSLILIPRVDEFGLFHDDITLSTSMLSPWTTLPAMATIVLLIGLGFWIRRRRPLTSLGVLWFFTAHLLESTIFPLEIAHEHRNYLALFGVLLVALDQSATLQSRTTRPLPLWRAAVLAVLIVLAAITALRAHQWSSEERMAYYEAIHHPESPATLVRYANLLLGQGKTDESLELARRAATLAPDEPSYLLGIQAVVVSRGGKVSDAESQEIVRRLSTSPISASTLLYIQQISNCITTSCADLQPHLQSWANAILKNPRAKDVSYTYFVMGRALLGQGKYEEAAAAYRRSYELDNNFAHPLLDLIGLYLFLERPDYAQVVLDEVHRIGQRTVYRHDSEITRLQKHIDRQLAAWRTRPNPP